uniref:C2 domain-containing protein n=1 Tax=Junco hyemalis TaxID=40217 RepID=A0A8C5IT84_JUNHY
MAKTAWLRCRLLEGKDLPAKDLTATVWKSLNPFWGEEITLLLPPGFHSLAIYVLDEDTIGKGGSTGRMGTGVAGPQQCPGRTMSSARCHSATSRSRPSRGVRGGTVGWGTAGPMLPPWGAHAVPSAGIASWLSLAPVSPDQEVQGEIHLELWVPEQGHLWVLCCHLIEARWGDGSSRGCHHHRVLFLVGRRRGGDGDSGGIGFVLPFPHSEGCSLHQVGDISGAKPHVTMPWGKCAAIPAWGQEHRSTRVCPQQNGWLSHHVVALWFQNLGKLRHCPGCPSGFGGADVRASVCERAQGHTRGDTHTRYTHTQLTDG